MGFESSLQDVTSYSSSFGHESSGEIELVVGVNLSLSERLSKRSLVRSTEGQAPLSIKKGMPLLMWVYTK
jgi:hypothetical protein